MKFNLIDFIRAIVRPALAIIAAAGTLGMLIAHIPMPDAWWGFLASAETFYFVQRAQEKNQTNGTPPK